MNIWAAIICVSVSLIRAVNSEYCDEKKSSEDIWQLISNFDPRNASKPSKGCSKHIDNFQKSLVSQSRMAISIKQGVKVGTSYLAYEKIVFQCTDIRNGENGRLFRT